MSESELQKVHEIVGSMLMLVERQEVYDDPKTRLELVVGLRDARELLGNVLSDYGLD